MNINNISHGMQQMPLTGKINKLSSQIFSENKSNSGKDISIEKTRENRNLLRQLNNEQRQLAKFIYDDENKKVFTSTTQEKMNEMFGMHDQNSSEEDELMQEEKYNYKDVSNQIRQAKDSVSASKAMLSAKRKVLEIRRKISAKQGDPEELQLALTHAKRMEMAARKKKNHLEIEELIKQTQRQDENKEKYEEAGEDIRNLTIEQAENVLSEAEDEIFEQRQDLYEDLEEAGADMEALNELVAEFGDEELEKLEESMEMLENIEVVDPHMSKEDFKELVLKHRNSEEKSLVKADMDYLKDTMALLQASQTTPVMDFKV